ncbi:MAG: FkbM family methyltransferase [Candidatus Micrarchaeota archaeon]
MAEGIFGKARVVAGIISLVNEWPYYLAEYLGLRKGGKRVYSLRNGIRYATRGGSSDKGVLNDIWIRNTYAPPGFEIRETDTVMDIGAHIGVFTIYAASKARKGKVFAFEPFPGNYAMVLENIGLNSAGNVVPFNAAVAGSGGKKRLFLSDENVCHSLYRFDRQGEKSVAVESMTLAQIFEKNGIGKVDLLKIDCEGAEYDILMGSDDSTLGKIEKISMEYHNIDENHTAGHMKRFLEGKGYRVEMGKSHPMIYARRIGRI